jgi:RNA 3'-terminal phosphate cyclase (ATP)
MIEIDGSQGEGGGQILRTSLALSMITGTPFRLTNIRARRKTSGLQRQHLMCVVTAADICGATLLGAKQGSGTLTFEPGSIESGAYRVDIGPPRHWVSSAKQISFDPRTYHVDIGTAGSTTLVLQTVLPALLMREEPSSLTIEGGTHNDHAPPFDFLEKAFVPLINRMGSDVSIELQRYGFYPKGGGKIVAKVGAAAPGSTLGRLELKERGDVRQISVRGIVSRLNPGIAEREVNRVARELQLSKANCEVIDEKRSDGPGNVVLIEVRTDRVTEVFTGFGAFRIPAEKVAQGAADEAKEYLDAEVPVGPHLADQLLLPMALGEGGEFLTQPVTEHTRTNADVIRMFLDVPIRFTEVNERQTLVEVG